MKDEIHDCCKELRLSTTFAENAISMSGDTHQDYLIKVLRAELEYRNNKRKRLHLKQAGNDNLKTFENVNGKVKYRVWGCGLKPVPKR